MNQNTTQNRIETLTGDAAVEEATRLLKLAASEEDRDPYTGKRGASRFRCPILMEVITEPNAPPQSITLEDISASGIRFSSRHEYSTGQPILLREFTGEDDTPWLSAQVAHCTPTVGGYRVGVALEYPASEEAVVDSALAYPQDGVNAATEDEPALDDAAADPVEPEAEPEPESSGIWGWLRGRRNKH